MVSDTLMSLESELGAIEHIVGPFVTWKCLIWRVFVRNYRKNFPYNFSQTSYYTFSSHKWAYDVFYSSKFTFKPYLSVRDHYLRNDWTFLRFFPPNMMFPVPEIGNAMFPCSRTFFLNVPVFPPILPPCSRVPGYPLQSLINQSVCKNIWNIYGI